MTPPKKTLLINHYLFSIESAKKLGYSTKIYTNTDSIELFKNVVDEVIVIDDYENSPLFDSFKIKVLEDETGEYFLIDGDVILHSKLPNLKYDLLFDTYETNNWVIYSKTIEKLTNFGLKNEINEWNSTKTNIFNCGILKFNNEEFKNIYIEKWKKYNQFILNNLDEIWDNDNNVKWFDSNINNITSVGAQYLLTILSSYYDIKSTFLQEKLQVKGKYYCHYSGNIKYENSIVPDKIFKQMTNKSLF
jgi:hypothetical protein